MDDEINQQTCVLLDVKEDRMWELPALVKVLEQQKINKRSQTKRKSRLNSLNKRPESSNIEI